ncbi:MAG: starch-binding protein, partial [Acutalibacteraceae bacterium]
MVKAKRPLAVVLALLMVFSVFLTAGTVSTSAAKGDTIYFEKPDSWGEVNCYVWGGSSGEAKGWPGTAMTAVSGNVYSYTMPGDQTKVIFNNGSGAQTGDAVADYDGTKNYFTPSGDSGNNIGGTWSVYQSPTNPTGTTATDPTSGGDTSKIYLKLNSNWGNSSPRFAAYFFIDSSTNKWADMTAVSGETDIYSAIVPSGAEWTKVIFCRMNPATTENAWSNKWNQSADITLDSSKNLYTLADGWDNISGTWSTYQGTEPTDPTVVTDPTAPQGVVINGTTYKKGDVVQITVKHQVSKILSGVSGFIKYDSSILKLAEPFTTTDSAFSAKLSASGSFMVNRNYNDAADGLGIAYAAMNAGTGYNFTTEGVLATAQFEVIAESGTTSITHKILEEYDMDQADIAGKTTYAVTLVSTTPTDPTNPTVTDPTVTDPTVTDPTVTDPTVTDPTVTDPTVTDPTVTNPTVTDPTASQGVVINGTTYKKGDVVQITVKHQASKILSGVSGFIKYDSSLLKLAEPFTTTDSAFSAKLSASGSFMVNRNYNDSTEGSGIAYAAMNAGTGYNFTTE